MGRREQVDVFVLRRTRGIYPREQATIDKYIFENSAPSMVLFLARLLFSFLFGAMRAGSPCLFELLVGSVRVHRGLIAFTSLATSSLACMVWYHIIILERQLCFIWQTATMVPIISSFYDEKGVELWGVSDHYTRRDDACILCYCGMVQVPTGYHPISITKIHDSSF